MDKVIYEIKSHFPVSLFISSIDGKHWVVPNWIELPNGTKFSQIKWIPILYEKFVDLAHVKASRGNTIYVISKKGNEYKCTCSGFKFKKGCKHVAEYIFKEKIIK